MTGMEGAEMKRSVGTVGFILLLGCLLAAGCSRGEASSPAVDSAGGNGDAVTEDLKGDDPETDKALGQNSGERPAVVYSYDETVFLINGKRFDASRDFEVGCNAIMDMFEVGDWVVVEGHINPHVGGYYFYNIYTEKVEKMITGANLTWKGDDITTAVYSYYTDLYNFKDNLLGSMDNEICELKFDPKEDLVYAEDFEENKQVFEIGPGDPAMYRYADYLRNKNEDTWNAFIKEAPEGIPNVCISASNKTGAGQFPVSVLSGQFDICGKFITASGE